MNLNRQAYIDSLEKIVREERRTSVRPPLVHGRRTEASVDVSQIPILETIDMRDPVTGEMFFVADYSEIGGPDVVA